MAYEYEFLNVEIEGRLAVVTISNPPINIFTPALYMEMSALTIELKADPSLTVVVFKAQTQTFLSRTLM